MADASGTNSAYPRSYFAVVDTAVSAVIVPAVSNKQIRIVSMDLVANALVTVSWQTSGGPTEISGPQPYSPTGGIVRTYNPRGWFQTGVGESLNIVISGAGIVGGNLTYELV